MAFNKLLYIYIYLNFYDQLQIKYIHIYIKIKKFGITKNHFVKVFSFWQYCFWSFRVLTSSFGLTV